MAVPLLVAITFNCQFVRLLPSIQVFPVLRDYWLSYREHSIVVLFWLNDCLRVFVVLFWLSNHFYVVVVLFIFWLNNHHRVNVVLWTDFAWLDLSLLQREFCIIFTYFGLFTVSMSYDLPFVHFFTLYMAFILLHWCKLQPFHFAFSLQCMCLNGIFYRLICWWRSMETVVLVQVLTASEFSLIFSFFCLKVACLIGLFVCFCCICYTFVYFSYLIPLLIVLFDLFFLYGSFSLHVFQSKWNRHRVIYFDEWFESEEYRIPLHFSVILLLTKLYYFS